MNTHEMIKVFEGLLLEAKKCPAGVWTIGWGHTRGVTRGQKISVAEAQRLLDEDVAEIEGQLDALVSEAEVELTRNQRSALVSFIFNVGIGAFAKSTLWKRIKANPADPRIEREFMRWVHASGRILPGLVSRRSQEAALYFAG